MNLYEAAKSGFKNRWVAFFDILGFANMVKNTKNSIDDYHMLEKYNQAVESLRKTKGYKEGSICKAWFSDSFILYSKDDSAVHYTWLSLCARQFICDCIDDHIPLRGAISFGPLLVDSEEKVIIGKALIEAYEESEMQDWIGLILTKSAINKIKKYGLSHPDHVNFVKVGIPIKERVVLRYAYTFNGTVYNGEHRLLPALGAMREAAKGNDEHKKERVKNKYDRTIAHINKYHRKLNVPKNK